MTALCHDGGAIAAPLSEQRNNEGSTGIPGCTTMVVGFWHSQTEGGKRESPWSSQLPFLSQLNLVLGGARLFGGVEG